MLKISILFTLKEKLRQKLCYKSKILIEIFILTFFISNIITINLAKAGNLVDTKSELYIDSEALTINKEKNSAIFEGAVKLQMSDMVIYTTILEIIYKNDNPSELKNKEVLPKQKIQIDKIIIPNKLKAIKDKDDEILIANEGIYIWDEGKLILTGDIKLIHQGSILKTQKLVYYTDMNKKKSNKTSP